MHKTKNNTALVQDVRLYLSLCDVHITSKLGVKKRNLAEWNALFGCI
jgi:hypothetical protein